MKVFVISLLSSQDRRQAATALLASAGVEFSFFDGLSGDVGPDAYFEGYDEQEYILNCGRLPTKGEIGCYASHRALWQKIVDDNEPMVIMEDDFALSENFALALIMAWKIIDECGYIRLQIERRAKRRLIRKIGEFSLYQYIKVPHSMMCYMVHPRVAVRLLERSRVLDAPVDVMVKKNWEHGCKIFGLAPYPVWDSEVGFASTIGGRGKYEKSILVGMKRAFRRLAWMWKMRWFNRVIF